MVGIIVLLRSCGRGPLHLIEHGPAHSTGGVKKPESDVTPGHKPWRRISRRPARGGLTAGAGRGLAHAELRYTINVALDGCVDHRVGIADAELHRFHAQASRAPTLLLYGASPEMMAVWRDVAYGLAADWVEDWMVPFAQTIDRAKNACGVRQARQRRRWNADLHPPAELGPASGR